MENFTHLCGVFFLDDLSLIFEFYTEYPYFIPVYKLLKEKKF